MARKALTHFDMDDIARQLARTNLLSGLSDTEIRPLISRRKIVIYNPRKIIIKEGDPGDFALLIIDGLTVVESCGVVVSSRHNGDLVGEFAVLDGGRRSSTIRAVTKVTALKISRNLLVDFISSHSRVKDNMMEILVAKLRESIPAQAEQTLALRDVRTSLQGYPHPIAAGWEAVKHAEAHKPKWLAAQALGRSLLAFLGAVSTSVLREQDNAWKPSADEFFHSAAGWGAWVRQIQSSLSPETLQNAGCVWILGSSPDDQNRNIKAINALTGLLLGFVQERNEWEHGTLSPPSDKECAKLTTVFYGKLAAVLEGCNFLRLNRMCVAYRMSHGPRANEFQYHCRLLVRDCTVFHLVSFSSRLRIPLNQVFLISDNEQHCLVLHPFVLFETDGFSKKRKPLVFVGMDRTGKNHRYAAHDLGTPVNYACDSMCRCGRGIWRKLQVDDNVY